MEKENETLFKSFTFIEEAIDLQNFLEQNNLNCLLVENKPAVDITFANNTILNSYEIHIDKNDFEKAEELVHNQAKEMIHTVDSTHYLFDFTNEELKEILIKPDEWNSYDYLLAKDILLQRGMNIDIDVIKYAQKSRLEELKKPERSNKTWIVLGYILAVLGGVVGIIIGYTIWKSRKNLPNGEMVYVYLDSDRKQGEYIFYIGIFAFLIFIILRFTNG